MIKLLIHLLVEFVVKQAKQLVIHEFSERSKLAQRKYKRRHGNVARVVHWKLCEKFNLSLKNLKNGIYTTFKLLHVNHKIIWNMNIQCDIVIEERKPDIVIANKMEQTAIIIDVAIPGNKRII